MTLDNTDSRRNSIGNQECAIQHNELEPNCADRTSWYHRRGFFDDFTFPYGFYGPAEYALWMREAGLLPSRIELIPKDMVQVDRAAFEGWVRTTWLPYTQRVPENKRKGFLAQFADSYIASNGADPEGAVHVKMVRLEVEALKQDPT